MKRNVQIGLFDCLKPRLRVLKKPKKQNKTKDDSDFGDLEDLFDENNTLKEKIAKLTAENDKLLK